MEKEINLKCPKCNYPYKFKYRSSCLIGIDSKDRWYPLGIPDAVEIIYKMKLNFKIIPNHKAIVSNIAYNLQYLEYLCISLKELNLSSVLITQQIKSIILYGTSIIEAILFMICCSNKLNYSDWSEAKTIKGNEFEINNKKYKIINQLFLKEESIIYTEINLDRMIKKIESKNLLHSTDHTIYKNLNYLRQLRNKIHIQVAEQYTTDFHSFNNKDYNLLLETLYSILTGKIIKLSDKQKHYLHFLKEYQYTI